MTKLELPDKFFDCLQNYLITLIYSDVLETVPIN